MSETKTEGEICPRNTSLSRWNPPRTEFTESGVVIIDSGGTNEITLTLVTDIEPEFIDFHIWTTSSTWWRGALLLHDLSVDYLRMLQGAYHYQGHGRDPIRLIMGNQPRLGLRGGGRHDDEEKDDYPTWNCVRGITFTRFSRELRAKTIARHAANDDEDHVWSGLQGTDMGGDAAAAAALIAGHGAAAALRKRKRRQALGYSILIEAIKDDARMKNLLMNLAEGDVP